MKSFFHGRTSPRAQGIFFGVGATFGLQLSDRASLTVADRFRSAYTGEAIDFVDVDEDVILPQAGQRRNHLTGGLSFQVSSLNTISLNVTWDKALFQQEEVFQPRLRNGERFASGLHLSRKLNDLNTINLGYTYARSAHALSPADIHSVSLGFSRKLGEFTNAGISIGASHRASFDGDLNAISGGLAISRALENSSFTLGYGRNLGPVFGRAATCCTTPCACRTGASSHGAYSLRPAGISRATATRWMPASATTPGAPGRAWA
jgi:hypothetical protein